MENQLISDYTAKLALEKGCDLTIYGDGYEYTDKDGNEYWTSEEFGVSGNEDTHPVVVMTQSLLQRWLRVTHKLHIEISRDEDGWEYSLYEYSHGNKYIARGFARFSFYELALESGLQKALNMINSNGKEN